MTEKDRIILEKMEKWARKAETDYQGVRSEFEPGPFSNSVILTAFSLAQIWKLTTRLSEEFQKEHTEVPWKQIRGMRNLIVHDYDGINLRILESTVEADLPELRQQLRAVLDAERGKRK